MAASPLFLPPASNRAAAIPLPILRRGPTFDVWQPPIIDFFALTDENNLFFLVGAAL
jgi:hypothetical protein